jgi:tetratricopeptide (TPR) repeat protein
MRLLMALAVAASAAGSTRREFDRAVAMVQASPENAALREKVIGLAKELRPAPALPKEAYRRMARGAAAVADAKSESDFLAAALEFEAAALAAPWWGDAYHNLGVAYEKAGEPKKSLAALKLAQLVAPESKDVARLVAKASVGRGKDPAPPGSALEGNWSHEKQQWRASTRPDGQLEVRLMAVDGVDANNSERFVLGAASLQGDYLWDGRLPGGRRRCPAMSAPAAGSPSPAGDALTLEFKGPLYERDCGEVPRRMELRRLP